MCGPGILTRLQDVRLCAVGAPGGSRASCRRGKKDSIKDPGNKLRGVEPKFSTRQGSDGGIALDGARSCLVRKVQDNEVA